jgi:hypothetical protein
MSLVDALAFVKHGDKPRNFTRWLDTYADLQSIGITSVEPWEFRNALLHMTTLESRKVLAGKVPRLIPLVGRIPPEVSIDSQDHKHFSLSGLIHVVAAAIPGWIATYNHDRNKVENFVARYDTVLSDARVANIQFG